MHTGLWLNRSPGHHTPASLYPSWFFVRLFPVFSLRTAIFGFGYQPWGFRPSYSSATRNNPSALSWCGHCGHKANVLVWRLVPWCQDSEAWHIHSHHITWLNSFGDLLVCEFCPLLVRFKILMQPELIELLKRKKKYFCSLSELALYPFILTSVQSLIKCYLCQQVGIPSYMWIFKSFSLIFIYRFILCRYILRIWSKSFVML